MTRTYITRHTLLARIRDPQDSEAWKEFIDFYKNYIYIIIRSMNITPHDADDILQQVTIKLWKNLPNHLHDPEKGRFRSWVSTVTKNTVLSFIKKQKNRNEKMDQAEKEKSELYLNDINLPDIDAIAQKEWQVFVTNTAFENLTERFTPQAIEAFKMSINGFTPNEIAEKLTISRDSIYKYISRVKVRFIDEIAYLRQEMDV
ncbi:MAG: RNA polymerase sigma factor [Lentisphaeraceae bacterium]|nr:RNA polymerase sigma factor [Lentisphaeraceae bacterium]